MAMPKYQPHATAADLATFERHEIVAGTIVQKASPSFEHGDSQGTIFGSLMGFRGRGGGNRPGGWWFATEVEVEFETHEVYVPDIAGWRRDRVPKRPSGRPVRIRPDWVCEILSPSTASRDMGVKQQTFHKCGVGHYWIVDPKNETLTVFRWDPNGYVIAMAAGPGDRSRAEPFEAIELDIGTIFGREPLLDSLADSADESVGDSASPKADGSG